MDQYDSAFPNGALRTEARGARLEAVIQLQDWTSALDLLDGMTSFPEPVGADLLLTRAELRARAERCSEALADFSWLLEGRVGSPVLSDAARERALYGSAICFGHLRQDDRARAALTAYQRRFPGGRFASDVERLLRGEPSSSGGIPGGRPVAQP